MDSGREDNAGEMKERLKYFSRVNLLLAGMALGVILQVWQEILSLSRTGMEDGKNYNS